MYVFFVFAASLLQRAGLTSLGSLVSPLFSPLSVITPTKDAFARLPKGVLDFLQSGTDAANATLKTILTSILGVNGSVNKIDGVLLLAAAVATVVQTIGQDVMTSPSLMRPQPKLTIAAIVLK